MFNCFLQQNNEIQLDLWLVDSHKGDYDKLRHDSLLNASVVDSSSIHTDLNVTKDLGNVKVDIRRVLA